MEYFSCAINGIHHLRGSTLLPLYSSSALSPCVHRCRCKCRVNFSVQLTGKTVEKGIFYEAPWLTRLTVYTCSILCYYQPSWWLRNMVHFLAVPQLHEHLVWLDEYHKLSFLHCIVDCYAFAVITIFLTFLLVRTDILFIIAKGNFVVSTIQSMEIKISRTQPPYAWWLIHILLSGCVGNQISQSYLNKLVQFWIHYNSFATLLV